MAHEEIVRVVLEQVNERRRAHGVPTLKMNDALSRAAQKHADDMSRRSYFGHNTKGGLSWDKRIKKIYGNHEIGENIAYGQDDPREVVEAWMNSPPHRHNILHDGYSEIGVGFCRKGNYWVQDFGDRS